MLLHSKQHSASSSICCSFAMRIVEQIGLNVLVSIFIKINIHPRHKSRRYAIELSQKSPLKYVYMPNKYVVYLQMFIQAAPDEALEIFNNVRQTG